MTHSNTYDVAIIGGGINGLGTARDLAMRGLKVYLAERQDFGVGATGNSSGMIHGGVRYLLHDPAVTQQSCKDSGYIQNIAKNLIFRIPFVFPVYDQKKWASLYLTLTEIFFEAYDRFQPLKNGLPHGKLTREETLHLEPGIRENGLIGAITTDEWGIDAYRLCLLNALDARNRGAVIENYTEVTSLLREANGQVCGFVVRNSKTAKSQNIHAKLTLNCTGAWNASFAGVNGFEAKVRPGKGVHLIFRSRISNYALITTAIDGRQVFLSPNQNESWMGTTDDDYFGDPSTPNVTADEVEYLMRAAENVFPRIRDYECFSTLVGLRPTIYAYGPAEDDLSREHKLIDHAAQGSRRLVSMIGGKLASYRVMAEELADEALIQLSRPAVECQTGKTALPGQETLASSAALATEFKVDPIATERLVQRHGTHARAILEEGRSRVGGLEVICACEPTLECEVRHALRHEWVSDPTDLRRRCRVTCGPCLGLHCAAEIGRIYAEEKGLSSAQALEASHTLVKCALDKTPPAPQKSIAQQIDRIHTRFHL